jgi:hypothetical protein
MAYTTTYAQLVADLQDIVESTNPQFVAQIPKIIAQAQDSVQRYLGLDIWRSYVNQSTTSLSRTMSRTASWLEVRSIYLTASGAFLQKRSPDWIRMFGPSEGVPRYWAERDETTFTLAPKPDSTYAVEIEITTRLPALSSSNTTNWITSNAADMLLLACLIGCETYLASPERTAQFKAMYEEIASAALRELRQQERMGYEPTRAASEPSVNAGARA